MVTDNRSGPAETGGAKAKISARNLWKLFGDSPEKFLAEHDSKPSPETVRENGYIGAVQDVNLDVREGEILVIMGLSGSGKSTLVRCLSRLIEPTGGQLLLDDEDLLTASDKDMIGIRRHKMGMVFQHFALFPHRTVAQNVAFPLEVQGMPRAERLARATEILNLVGLSGREGYYPRELSGGQQQRVGIARSLAVEPEIWFLDEPFSALDPLIRKEMQDEFLRLQDVLHTTIVFITHDFDEAIRLADRIVIMYDGEIVQIGTAEDLVISPATDYVEAFTKDLPRDKLLTVGSIMEPKNGALNSDAIDIPADSLVTNVIGRMFTEEGPFKVVDAEGAAVGVISRKTIIDKIFTKTD